MDMRRRRAALLGVVLVAVLLALAGCSGGKDASNVKAADLRPRLAKARATLDDATSLDFRLRTSQQLPTGVKGLTYATGVGTHDPAFKGKVKVSVGGSTISADVIAVDAKVYAKAGFSPLFVPLDPASLGAPDPASLMKTDGGVSSLLTDTQDLQAGKQTRDGKDVLTSITGTLPGTAVRGLIPSAHKDATFQARYRLTDKDVLRDATIKGPFYTGDKDVTYTIAITASDKNVSISAP